MSLLKVSCALVRGATSALLLGALPALAEEGRTDPLWPCEQAFVSEVSAAVVWDGPSVEGLSGQWREVPDIASLVMVLTAPRADPKDAEARIDAFAEVQPAESNDQNLTILFAGVLQALNADRRKLNAGILRYSRDQERRAGILDAKLTEMIELEADPSESAQRKLAALMQRLVLEQRMFDDREKTIPYLCTRPQRVEQRLGVLARAIASRLD